MSEADYEAQVALMKVVAGWVLVTCLVITVLGTLFSMFGWIVIKNSKLRKTLYSVLIIEVAVVGAAFFMNLLELNVDQVISTIAKPFRDKLSAAEIEMENLEASKKELMTKTETLSTEKSDLEEKNVMLAQRVTDIESEKVTAIGKLKRMESAVTAVVKKIDRGEPSSADRADRMKEIERAVRSIDSNLFKRN